MQTDKRKYAYEVCGKSITDDEGVTTLNGLWVCDSNTCRTLDEESQAHERKKPLCPSGVGDQVGKSFHTLVVGKGGKLSLDGKKLRGVTRYRLSTVYGPRTVQTLTLTLLVEIGSESLADEVSDNTTGDALNGIKRE